MSDEIFEQAIIRMKEYMDLGDSLVLAKRKSCRDFKISMFLSQRFQEFESYMTMQKEYKTNWQNSKRWIKNILD